MLTTSVVILLLLFQLLFGREKRTGQIMDIGLRSLGEPEAMRNAAIMLASLGLFLLVTLTFGLQYAAVLFAGGFPLIAMKGRARVVTSIVGVVLVSLMAFGLLDYYMGVYWPEPYIGEWLHKIL
jgi:hypothetical protein